MLAEIKHELGEPRRRPGQLGSNILASEGSLSVGARHAPKEPGPGCRVLLHAPRLPRARHDRGPRGGKRQRLCIDHGPYSQTHCVADAIFLGWHRLVVTRWSQSCAHTGTLPRGLPADTSPHLDAGHAGVPGLTARAALRGHRGAPR